MNTLKKYIWCFILSGILAGVNCGFDDKVFSEADFATVKGIIRGSVTSGTPFDNLRGIRVSTVPENSAALTNYNGNYTISNVLINKYYRIQFSHPDFRDTVTTDSFFVSPFAETVVPAVKLKSRYVSYVSGKVTSSGAGISLGNAWVWIEGQYARTYTYNDTGSFMFYSGSIEPGVVRIFAGKDSLFGFVSVPMSAEEEVSGVTIDLDKIATSSISGRVVDSNLVPRASARVNVLRGVFDTLTDSLGRFVIPYIPDELKITLSIRSGQDSLRLDGFQIKQGKDFPLGDIIVKPKSDVANITVLSSYYYAQTGDTSLVVNLDIIKSPTVLIQRYDWDLNNDGIWETTTFTDRILLTGLTPPVSKLIKVRCTSDTATLNNFSNTAQLTIKFYSFNNWRLISPLSGTTVPNLTPALKWSKGAYPTFTVFLDTINPPIAPCAANLADTTFNVTGLIAQKLYYWRVIGTLQTNASDTSAVWKFVTP